MTTINTMNAITQTSNLIVQANTDASGVTAGMLIGALVAAVVLTGVMIGFAHWMLNR